MIIKPFGSAFTFDYYPLVGGDAITPVAQTPAIYIFDAKPSDADARAGTGSIETITVWTEITAGYRPFTVAAISDPADGTKDKKYYAAINFMVATGGTVTVDVQEFTLSRPQGFTATPLPSVAEVKVLDKSVANHFTDQQITDAAATAQSLVRAGLTAKGYEWSRIRNSNELKLAITYRAISELWWDEISEENDRFDRKYISSMALAHSLVDELRLAYDTNDDDTIDETEGNTPAQGVIRLIR